MYIQVLQDPPAGDPAAALAPDLANPRALLEWLGQFSLDYGPRVVGALLTILVGLWLVGWVSRGMRAALTRAKVEPTLASFLANAGKLALTALVCVSAIGQLGVETASFVAILGAVGFAVGFALQGSLGNLAAGVMILFFRPFKVGDYIEAGGAAGVVEEIAVFSTILRTVDNKTVIVPNAQVTNGTITNFSANPTRRVDLTFGIAYDDDIRRAKGILERLVAADERILQDPAPVIAVGALADSSVNLLCRPWVRTADYWNVCWDLTEKVKEAFDAEGVTIPFPQREVHLRQAGEAAAGASAA